MTLVHAKNGTEHSRCRRCDHDLYVKRDGKVYCSNARCPHYRRAHSMRDNLSIKGASERKVRA